MLLCFSCTEIQDSAHQELFSGWPRFGSVRLRFGDGTVRAVPLFGSGGSSKEGGFVCFSTVSQRGRFRFRFLETVPVPRSVPAKTVPTVPVRITSHFVPKWHIDFRDLFCSYIKLSGDVLEIKMSVCNASCAYPDRVCKSNFTNRLL